MLLFLFGLYYWVIPAAGATLLAKVQGWLHILGAILFPVGVALVLLKGPSFEAAPITGALAIVGAMTLFAIIVFRTSRPDTSSSYLSKRPGLGDATARPSLSAHPWHSQSDRFAARHLRATHEETMSKPLKSAAKTKTANDLFGAAEPKGARPLKVAARAAAPKPATPRPISRCSKGSSRCAAGPACISAAPTKRRCITCSPKSSTTPWTRRWPGHADLHRGGTDAPTDF